MGAALIQICLRHRHTAGGEASFSKFGSGSNSYWARDQTGSRTISGCEAGHRGAGEHLRFSINVALAQTNLASA